MNDSLSVQTNTTRSRSTSPHRKSPLGPVKNSSTLDDGSAFGYGSVVGHDDPTAVMGNVVRREADLCTVKSIGTIASFVTAEDENVTEEREPIDDIENLLRIPSSKADEDLREKLDEIDRLQEQWESSQAESKAFSTHTRGDVEDFYVQEVGNWQKSTKNSELGPHKAEGTISIGPDPGTQDKTKSLPPTLELPESNSGSSVSAQGEIDCNETVELEKSEQEVCDDISEDGGDPDNDENDEVCREEIHLRNEESTTENTDGESIRSGNADKTMDDADISEGSSASHATDVAIAYDTIIGNGVSRTGSTKDVTSNSGSINGNDGINDNGHGDDNSHSGLADVTSDSGHADETSDSGHADVTSDSGHADVTSDSGNDKSDSGHSDDKSTAPIAVSSTEECATGRSIDGSNASDKSAGRSLHDDSGRYYISPETSCDHSCKEEKPHSVEWSDTPPLPSLLSDVVEDNVVVDDKGTIQKSDDDAVATSEIVRQVQLLLNGRQTEGPHGPVGVSDSRPNPEQSKGNFRAYIPIVDEGTRSQRYGGLAAQTDISDEESSIGESRYRYRRIRFCRVFLPCLFLLIVVALIILGLILSNERRHSVDAVIGLPPEPTIPTTSSPTSSLESPTIAPTTRQPIAIPTVITLGPTTWMPNPTRAPVTRPPTGSPVALTISPTTLVTSRTNEPATTQPIFSTMPTSPESARDKLYAISGDKLDDPTSPQSVTFEWLLDDDPANLDLDALSVLELTQRYVAALLFFSTNGDNWENSFHFMDASHVCEWHDEASGMGIQCNTDSIIEEMTINENNLTGSLPFELEQLSALKKIQFRGNSVAGSLPSEFGRLSELEELDLRNNELEGTFPASVLELPNLKKLLMLRNEDLGGQLPNTIHHASNLEMISFQHCQLTGSLPSNIGLLSNLYFLTLLDNELTGTIPDGLGLLSNLEVLELSDNYLSGSIPSFIGQSGLYFISLYKNRLSGTIPESIGDLPGLLFFDVRENELFGSIPTTFNNVPELVTFHAAYNRLTGSIPSFSGNSGFLQNINCAGNLLNGTLDDIFANGPLERLHTINLGSNTFSGTIPTTIGKFTVLTDLILDANDLEGSIPFEIGSLSLLDTFLVNGNFLRGTIPDELGLLTRLQYLDLGGNDLTGTLSDTLNFPDGLAVLDLSDNELSGSVPSSWTFLRNLDELYLQGNMLSGDLDIVLCPDGSPLTGKFLADCAPPDAEVTCTCCTACCNDSSDRCTLS